MESLEDIVEVYVFFLCFFQCLDRLKCLWKYFVHIDSGDVIIFEWHDDGVFLRRYADACYFWLPFWTRGPFPDQVDSFFIVVILLVVILLNPQSKFALVWSQYKSFWEWAYGCHRYLGWRLVEGIQKLSLDFVWVADWTDQENLTSVSSKQNFSFLAPGMLSKISIFRQLLHFVKRLEGVLLHFVQSKEVFATCRYQMTLIRTNSDSIYVLQTEAAEGQASHPRIVDKDQLVVWISRQATLP